MRHQFTRAERSLGGKRSALHPDRQEICSKGFWACIEKHPFMYNRLKKKIKAYNEAKAQQQGG